MTNRNRNLCEYKDVKKFDKGFPYKKTKITGTNPLIETKLLTTMISVRSLFINLIAKMLKIFIVKKAIIKYF